MRWTPEAKLAAITKAQIWFNCGTVEVSFLPFLGFS